MNSVGTHACSRSNEPAREADAVRTKTDEVFQSLNLRL